MKYVAFAITAMLSLSALADQRSAATVRMFRAQNPCPSTGKTKGACPGFHADHRIPICAGGRDSPENLQWLSVADHKWKTFVDVRECRKLRKMAETPAR